MKMKNIAVIIGIAVMALAGASVTVTQQNEYKLMPGSKAPSRFPKRPCCT